MNCIDVGLAGQCGLGLLLIDDLDWEDRALVHRLERALVKLEGEGGAGAGLVVVVTTRAGAAQLEQLLLDRCRTAGLQVYWNVLCCKLERGVQAREKLQQEELLAAIHTDTLPLVTALRNRHQPID